MTDLRQTPQYAKYMKALAWSAVRFQVPSARCQVFIRKIPLIGSVAKLQRPQRVNFNQIKQLIKRNNLAVFYLEPSAPISFQSAKIRFKLAKSAFLPSKTIHLDLSKSEYQLLKEMKPKTRYNIKIAQKRGVVVKKSTDINTFVNLWKSSARRRFALPQDKEIKALWDAFGQKALLLVAYQAGRIDQHVHSKNAKPLGGVLVACSNDTAYYMYAASNRDGKKLFAPTLLAWEAIKLSKKLKLKTFDFEGVYDPRYSSTTSWRGFTKFKEGFGGKVIAFPRTLVCHQNPLLKFLNF